MPLYGQDMVSFGSTFIGKNELDHRQELSALLSVDPLNTPWCAAFVNAILKSYQKPQTSSLLAKSFLNYGRAAKKPRRGDIIVFDRGERWQGHVGFYIKSIHYLNQEHYLVLSGNTGIGKYHEVNVGSYPANKAIAIRRPL